MGLLGWLGCGCCGEFICVVKFCTQGCGANLCGVTVTIKSGATTIATGTTSGSPCCVSLTIPSAGTYTVTATASGYLDWSQSLALVCGQTYTINLTTTNLGTYCGCCNNILSGATLYATDANGTHAFTELSGVYSFNYDLTVSGAIGGSPCASGTYDVCINYTLQCVTGFGWQLQVSWNAYVVNGVSCAPAQSPCATGPSSCANNVVTGGNTSTIQFDCTSPVDQTVTFGPFTSVSGLPVTTCTSIVGTSCVLSS